MQGVIGLDGSVRMIVDTDDTTVGAWLVDTVTGGMRVNHEAKILSSRKPHLMQKPTVTNR